MSERQVSIMEKQNQEQMIYLKDLIFTALRSWRTVVVVALVAAVLLGGLQGMSAFSAMNTPVDPAASEAAQQLYEEQKTAMDLQLQSAQESVDEHMAYLEESLLMQLNPYGYYDVAVSLYAQANQPAMLEDKADTTADVLHAYKTVLLSGPVLQMLAEELDTQIRYVQEVLTVEQSDTANALLVNIMVPTEEAANAVLDLLENRLDAAAAQISRDVAEHKAAITAQSVNEKLDLELRQIQQDAYAHIDELELALTEAKSERAMLAPPAMQSGSVKTVIKSAVIWAVAGAVLGAFLVVGVLWVAHIGSDKVYAARNLTNRTGVKVIGNPGSEKKNLVDRLVYRLEGRNADAPELNLVATDIRCRAKEAKNVLIAGSAGDAQRAMVLKAVSAAMPGVQVEDRGSILCSAEALEALSVCDAVVLVEQTGVSHYTAVRKQAKIINDYGAELLGCVLMEK